MSTPRPSPRAKPERSPRRTRRGADDFLPELLRFCPPETRVLVEAVFILGRELRERERDDGRPVNDIGVFLDMIDTAAAEWKTIARVLNLAECATTPPSGAKA